MLWNGVEEDEISDKVDQLLPPFVSPLFDSRPVCSKGILRGAVSAENT